MAAPNNVERLLVGLFLNMCFWFGGGNDWELVMFADNMKSPSKRTIDNFE